MKILVLDQFSDLGGAQRMLLDLLEAARERAWQVSVGLPGAGSVCDRARSLGFDVVPIACGGYSSGRKSAADIWRFGMEAPRLARRIRELVGEFRPDLVYINGPRLLPAAALAGFDAPALFHAHIGVSQRAARRLAGLSLRRLDASVVAVCGQVAEVWKPFAGDRLSVVYNGVAGPNSEIRRSFTGPLRIGCIGRVAPEKGQLEFINLARRIHAAIPATRFVIAGAPLFSDRGALAYESAVRAAAAGLPVEFTGWVDDVYSVLRRLDLLLAPSQWEEANPRVILEAFAAGVPVVALRRGGVPEIIEPGRTGFLCEGDGEMAALAIDLARGDRRRLSAVAEAARERWERGFTRQRWQQEMAAEIERCARGVQRAASAATVSA